MEAPEKIYRRREGNYIKYYDYKPAKIRYNEKEPTEYTRTDAFIEKAQNFFRHSHYLFNLDGMDLHNFIEDFKKVMKV